MGYAGIGTHSFRKYYATEIYKASHYNIALVQQLLQHSSTTVTQRYVGIQPQEVERAIENHCNLMCKEIFSMKILLTDQEKTLSFRRLMGHWSRCKNCKGYIEILYPFDDPIALVCNEEGKLLGLPLNRSLRDSCGQNYDAIAGTFFLCRIPTDCDSLESLT